MKNKTLILIAMLLSLGAYAAAGDFVRGIEFPPLKFVFPVVAKEKQANITFYNFPNEEIPMGNIEISLYGSHSALKGKPYELPQVLAHALLYGGSRKHPGATLLSALENTGARLEIVPEYKKIVIKLSFLTDDSKAVLDLLEELLTDPLLDAAVVADGKNRQIELIKRRNERTESTGFRKTQELVFHGFQPGNSGSEESVKQISPELVRDFFNYHISGTDKAVLLHGRLDKLQTEKRLQQILNRTFPVTSSYEKDDLDYTLLKKQFDAFKVKQLYVEKDVSQSMVMMAGIMPPHNHPDFYAVTILNYIIGGGGFNSYFMTRIRSEKGLAYASVSYPVFSADYGVLYCYSLTKAESTNEVVRLMNEILSEKTVAAISDEEISNAKNAIINKFIFLFNEDAEVIRNTLRFDEDKMPAGYLENYRQKMMAVTKNDIVRAGKYFSNQGLKTVIVGKGSLRPEGYQSILPEEVIVEQ